MTYVNKENEDTNSECLRVQKLIDRSNFKKAEFARWLGIGPSVLNHFLKGRNNISIQMVKALLKKYPELNIKWLLFGEGEMFTNVHESENNQLKILEIENKFLKEKINDKEQIIQALKSK